MANPVVDSIRAKVDEHEVLIASLAKDVAALKAWREETASAIAGLSDVQTKLESQSTALKALLNELQPA